MGFQFQRKILFCFVFIKNERNRTVKKTSVNNYGNAQAFFKRVMKDNKEIGSSVVEIFLVQTKSIVSR